ncbi:AKP13-like protein [Mya arenaria]|uniref:AKP13-like protein n=1 Tax=Mya arenaria TaxID=6604 RepID=A0ABY7DMP9_MYAAR|nr:AKP13-like protein [Mya arenaria]
MKVDSNRVRIGHSEEEDVLVSVVDFQGPQVSAPLLARGHITFRTDSTFHLAEFLRDSVFHIDSLADLELIKGDNFNIANEELSTLDVRLSRALTYLGFPEWWSLLGNESNSESPAPRESLLHFSARLGLVKVTGFFLRRTGSEACLKLPNSRGHLPRDVALDHGFNGLAELLSEYNLTSLLPIGRWIQREEGRFQTQDTGDVTLTADLQNHHKTLVDDYCAPADIYSDPNLDGGHDGGHDDDIEMSEDCDVAMEMDSHDQTEGDEETHDIMVFKAETREKTFYKGFYLQFDYKPFENSPATAPVMIRGQYFDPSPSERAFTEDKSEKYGVQQNTGTAFFKDLRAENLARFSTSCPSLDNESRNSPLPVIDEADHHKSMVDLADDNVGDSGASPASMCSGDVYSSGPDIADGSDGVHIIVDDFYGGNVPQVRRRSFSPQPMKPPVLQEREPDNNNMLIHANKSVNLLPAEEDTDEDSFPSREDVSGSDGNLSGGGDSYRRHLKSDGDAMVTQRRRILQNGETDVNVRGKENNVRYSADGHHSGSHLEAMSSVSRGDGRILSALPHGKITKALSMSSIPAATNADKTKGSGLKGNDKASSNFTDSGLSSPKQKEEKKPKKPGVFSRFHSSYRIKKNKEKEGKENKLRAASHRFVQVSFSNATTCDVCRKPLINKPASSCQTCLLNVHDSSCKEHITACDKSKLKTIKMTDQYYYNCLVPDAIQGKPRIGASGEESPPPPPPRPPRSQATYSAHNSPQPYTQVQHVGLEKHRPRDHSLPNSEQHGVRDFLPEARSRGSEVSPKWFQDSAGRIYNDLESGQSQSPKYNHGRSKSFQYGSEYELTAQSAPNYSNLSPVVSPKWNKVTNQFNSPPYDPNMSVASEPTPSMTEMSPRLPDRSPRRHTIDANMPLPLRLSSAENSPALPAKSHARHGSSVDEYSSGSFKELAPGVPKSTPRSAGFEYSPSYEYPQSSPRKQECLQGPLARQSSTDGDGGSPNQDKNNGSTGVTSMRSASFRDNSTRVVNSYAGSSTQPLPGAEVPVQPDIAKLQSAAAQLQRHSLPTPSSSKYNAI